jgi:hypothetical protein
MRQRMVHICLGDADTVHRQAPAREQPADGVGRLLHADDRAHGGVRQADGRQLQHEADQHVRRVKRDHDARDGRTDGGDPHGHGQMGGQSIGRHDRTPLRYRSVVPHGRAPIRYDTRYELAAWVGTMV